MDSLVEMMNGCEADWLKYFKIPAEELPEMDSRLFTMNIHDLSLFPDMEGLAGFVLQKT